MTHGMLRRWTAQLAKIELTIDQREWTYEERSESWQDSGKGELYEEKTTELQEVKMNLETTIESLKIYLDV